MSSTAEEAIEAYKEINITSYITNVTTWLFGFGCLVESLDKKTDPSFWANSHLCPYDCKLDCRYSYIATRLYLHQQAY